MESVIYEGGWREDEKNNHSISFPYMRCVRKVNISICKNKEGITLPVYGISLLVLYLLGL